MLELSFKNAKMGGLLFSGMLLLFCLTGLGCKKSSSQPDEPVDNGIVSFWLSDPGLNIKFTEQDDGIETGKGNLRR